jgi:hypothetical protein
LPVEANQRAFCKSLSSLVVKNILLHYWPKSSLLFLPARPNEGRFAIVTNVGWDAMDAAASSREVDRRAGFP